MPALNPFILVSPSTRGLSLALTRHYLKTTNLPVYATHRSDSPDSTRNHILSTLDKRDVDPERLRLLHVELTSEDSIATAARALKESLPSASDTHSYIHTAFLTGGVLHPEKQPSDLSYEHIMQSFQVNVIAHLLMIKHFSPFLPPSAKKYEIAPPAPARWVHVSARVGSVSDNNRGGWYSYRASKAALNQVVKTFDLHLQMRDAQALCVGVHPGTVHTDLSERFWTSGGEGKFEPEEAAERLAGVVGELKQDQRGRTWDWAGKEVHP